MRRVLLADDDPVTRAALAEALMDEGYDVHAVQDGEAALAGVSTFAPDVIVADVVMPKVNGLEVWRTLDAREGAPPVLLMTGTDRPDIRRRVQSTGAICLTKPLELDALLDQLAEMCPERASSP